MKISVALCTYNGGAYLKEQLASIVSQTRRPDELVICDDASSDDSVALAHSFAGSVPFDIRIFCAEKNLGSTKNFERAISLCTGDVIVLSDQDDVWMTQKLERITQAFMRRPGLAMVFSDAIVVDAEMRLMKQRLWQTLQLDDARLKRIRHGAAFFELLNGNFITGATMAFAANVRGVALPIPLLRSRIHDGWLALVAAALGPVESIAEPSIYYRQHLTQQMGVRRPSWLSQFRDKLDFEKRASYGQISEDLACLRGRLTDWQARLTDASVLRHLDNKVKHDLARSGMPRRGITRAVAVLSEVMSGRYRYSRGWRSVFRDLLLY